MFFSKIIPKLLPEYPLYFTFFQHRINTAYAVGSRETTATHSQKYAGFVPFAFYSGQRLLNCSKIYGIWA